MKHFVKLACLAAAVLPTIFLSTDDSSAQGTSTTRRSETQERLDRIANRGDRDRDPPLRQRRPPPPPTFRGAPFPRPIEKQMRAIAADHFKKSPYPLHVNRGLSTPKQQAGAMYVKFNLGEYSGTYRPTPTYNKILKAYLDYKDEAVPGTIDEMEKVIASEMAAGRLISDHLDGYAVDLRIYWIYDLDILPAIVARHGGQMRVEGAPPHIHIWFPKPPKKRI